MGRKGRGWVHLPHAYIQDTPPSAVGHYRILVTETNSLVQSSVWPTLPVRGRDSMGTNLAKCLIISTSVYTQYVSAY